MVLLYLVRIVFYEFLDSSRLGSFISSIEEGTVEVEMHQWEVDTKNESPSDLAHLWNLAEVHFNADDLAIMRVAVDYPADTDVTQSVETLDRISGPFRPQQLPSVRVNGERSQESVSRI